jgi:hypothetical protein
MGNWHIRICSISDFKNDWLAKWYWLPNNYWLYGPANALRIPLWIPAAAATIPAIILWRRKRPQVGNCPTCGYNLTGNVSGICPECGSETENRIRPNP